MLYPKITFLYTNFAHISHLFIITAFAIITLFIIYFIISPSCLENKVACFFIYDKIFYNFIDEFSKKVSGLLTVFIAAKYFEDVRNNKFMGIVNMDDFLELCSIENFKITDNLVCRSD
jgi:hypothetical protein